MPVEHGPNYFFIHTLGLTYPSIVWHPNKLGHPLSIVSYCLAYTTLAHTMWNTPFNPFALYTMLD